MTGAYEFYVKTQRDLEWNLSSPFQRKKKFFFGFREELIIRRQFKDFGTC